MDAKRGKQLGLKLREKKRWGGERKGAGRKRTAPMRRVDHRTRPRLGERHAVHATWRVLPHVWNLRTHRSFAPMLGAFAAASGRVDARITRFSVQGNHIHLIVEADGTKALARAMQGLGIRLAKALNSLMLSKGAVFADRYHVRPLGSPREAWQAIRYVMRNHFLHAQRQGRTVADQADEYAVGPELLGVASALWRRLGTDGLPIAQPRGWLLRQGWMLGAPAGAFG